MDYVVVFAVTGSLLQTSSPIQSQGTKDENQILLKSPQRSSFGSWRKKLRILSASRWSPLKTAKFNTLLRFDISFSKMFRENAHDYPIINISGIIELFIVVVNMTFHLISSTVRTAFAFKVQLRFL